MQFNYLINIWLLMQGMEVTGVPEYVIVSGRVCVDECELKAVHGFGKYVNAEPFGTYVYDMINDKEKVITYSI